MRIFKVLTLVTSLALYQTLSSVIAIGEESDGYGEQISSSRITICSKKFAASCTKTINHCFVLDDGTVIHNLLYYCQSRTNQHLAIVASNGSLPSRTPGGGWLLADCRGDMPLFVRDFTSAQFTFAVSVQQYNNSAIDAYLDVTKSLSRLAC